ncbi:receptor-like protein EIX2 isoform X5 [Prosopis cineraria]|uniref:receptor-like protein EIX2 isoform X5 n=1 Tax=Prosopis cineraria TaxID=364024 RepID=UPI0024103E03|nr:receptor-like protein EIX2 isoform X5 [Prosopis cineraria]
MDSLLPSFLAVNVFILWSLLFVIILPKGMCSLRVRCNEKDRHALLNFKHTVVDPSAKLSGWSDERDCCEWIGVHCDNTTGRVIELNLSCSPKSVDDICQYKSQCLTASSMAVEFEGTVLLLIKGAERTYSQYLVCSIDISSNNMSGTLPSEIVSLAELRSLNLSHNQFEGNIPKEIGNLKQLESLDLASNRLSGEIPQSMVGLSFLGAMNLSFNNFSGKIPSGTQLQSFDALSYIGNPELCGAPLPKNCSNEKGMKPIKGYDNDQEDEFLSSFYIASGVGFSMAFWGVCIAIFCIRSFRNSYFRFLFRIRDKLYIMVALTVNRFS